MSSVAARVPGQQWIFGPVPDFLLFFGTPALIFPAVMLAQQRLTTDQLYLLVISFGALGHHLPGMMRAYGDRALFHRFRVRFIVAPLFLVATCTYLAFNNYSALMLMTFAWGAWHGPMQTHGFARIYDGKVGSTDKITAKLDLALVLSWFGAAVAFSPTRVPYVIERFYDAGGPVISLGFLPWLRGFVAGAVALSTIAFGAPAVRPPP
jgi:hypothetical protein